MSDSPHRFHIPVMGTGYTIDTPLHVARYGISAVISLVDDTLIEQMRELHAGQNDLPFTPIARTEPDARARRITAYLDQLDLLIRRQVEELRDAPFEEGSEITRYFRLLPEGPTRAKYEAMLALPAGDEKAAAQEELRGLVVPGTIDVNIMTKLDVDSTPGAEPCGPEDTDAMAALRGFALSTACGSLVFSAGMNPRLYGYAGEFDGFRPDADGRLRKRIVLKVSDYRSAEIQGRYLAKRGLWVSEFRVESSLNCGGHAFATEGLLLGPILQEFSDKRDGLAGKFFKPYAKALAGLGVEAPAEAPEIQLTVQGGIGNAEEEAYLRERYQVNATGWGTPFMFVPEVVNMDDDTLPKMIESRPGDVFLSDASPMGTPFWNLKNAKSEETRRARIESGKPGSACGKRHLTFNREFGDTPLCEASRAFVKLKLAQLETQPASSARDRVMQYVLSKACICHDLAGSATLKYGIDPEASPAVCCGPNAVYFRAKATLEEMVDHIYGRGKVLMDSDRPHMFIREIEIYRDFLMEEVVKVAAGLAERTQSSFEQFRDNLLSGMDYYRELLPSLPGSVQQAFESGLTNLRSEVEQTTQDAVQRLFTPGAPA